MLLASIAKSPKELSELARKEGKHPISYSQFSLFSSCPYAWKLRYIDKVKDDKYSIHLLFGTSMHTVLQEYVTILYKKGGTQADMMNFDKRLLEEMQKEFINNTASLPDDLKEFTSQTEMIEFYKQGLEILYFIRKNRGDYFPKQGWELVGIEVPIIVEADGNSMVVMIGFLDVVLKNTITRRYKIIDFKTSSRGWHKSVLNDLLKNSQLILYKKYYSKLYGIDPDLIDIEYLILRRFIFEEAEFPQKRVQRHCPASGKPTRNKVDRLIKEFTDVFDEKGNPKFGLEYQKKVSPASCKYCIYGETGICDKNKKK